MAANRGFASNNTREAARRHEKVESYIRRPRTTPRQPSALLLQHAASNPDAASPESILGLQSSYGNRAVASLLSGVQTRLKVGPVGDSYEREADRVAQQVMNMPAPAAGQSVSQRREGGAVQKSPLVSSITPRVQRQEKEEEPLNEGDIPTRSALQRQEEEEAAETALVQRQGDGGFEASGDIEARLNARRGGGSSLAREVRAFMEPRFGADFGGVRLHTDGEAAQISQSLGAQAFTHGKDIYFGQDRYSPGSNEGKRLLAHELTHVVQQNGATVRREEEGAGGGEEETEQEGSVPNIELGPEEAPWGGPEEGADASRGGRSTVTPPASTSEAAQPGNLTIDVGDVGLGFSSAETQLDGVSKDSEYSTTAVDTVSVGTVPFEFNPQSGAAVGAFGEASYQPSIVDMKWKAKSSKVKLDFKFKVNAPWGTNDGGRTDVPSATDGVVTKDTYPTIYSDLYPKKKEKSWVAPRTTYWSKAICERHEKYHVADYKKWSKGAGKKV